MKRMPIGLKFLFADYTARGGRTVLGSRCGKVAEGSKPVRSSTYARALRAKGETVRMIRSKTDRKKSGRPKVLHFGTSYVVAESFAAGSTRLDSSKRGAV